MKPFIRSFSREAKKEVRDVIDMSKECVKEIKSLEDDGNLAELMTSKVDKICILKNCITYLQNDIFLPKKSN